MRVWSLVMGVLAALLIGATAQAQERTLRQFIDGCRTDPITCVLDVQDAIILAETDAGVSCPPGGVTDREAQAALKWMQDQMQAKPALGETSAATMQQAAAKALWPCK